MASRFNLLPDARFTELGNQLTERVHSAARALDPATFGDVFDPVMRHLVADVLTRVAAHEGTIWLEAPDEHLVPVYNTGPNAGRFVGSFRQPLDRGIISLVFKKGQPLAQGHVYQSAEQDRTLDDALGVLTCTMIAVPLYFARELRGVLTCVRLKPPNSAEPDPPDFSPDDLHRVERLSVTLTRLLDHELVGTTVGWHAGPRRRS